ncbi:MAG: flagellar filament capping protein FliD, partial [Anaerolineales bacterium]
SDLQDAVYALRSSSYSSALTSSRSVSVNDVPSGYTVLTASASSNAIVGDYQINNITLAKSHRVRSDAIIYADQALGLSTADGYIVLGGADARSATSSSTNNTVLSFTTANVDAGKTELGKGDYYVEVRNDAINGWQFRLVDSSGKAISIRKGDSTSETSNSWQTIPSLTGVFDTGRGLVISFGTDPGNYQEGSLTSGNAVAVNYVAQGAHIQIGASDTLADIVSKINRATYAEGDGVEAGIVDHQLVLSAASTGTSHALNANNVIDNGIGGTSGVLHTLGLLASDSTNFKYAAVQEASNATFTVNGISVERSNNSGLTDVINGVTINLAADALGKSATISVKQDISGAKAAIQNFIKKFNDVITYLDQKTAVTSINDGTKTTYTRGTLADDNIFSELRVQLFSLFMQNYSNSSSYQSLRDIGLTINDSLQASISSNDKLESALNTDMSGVQTLFDTVMSQIDAKLGGFTGVRSNSDYLDDAVSNLNNQLKDINDDISNMNAYLDQRQQYLTDQYSELQAQLQLLSYTQQMWSSIYGTVNQLY